MKVINIPTVSIHVKNTKIKLDNGVRDFKTTLLEQNKSEKSARYILINFPLDVKHTETSHKNKY